MSDTTTTAPITASANARAILTITGILGLRPDEPGQRARELRDDGSCIWRLRGGITITVDFHDDGAHWHLDRDDDHVPAAAIGTGVNLVAQCTCQLITGGQLVKGHRRLPGARLMSTTTGGFLVTLQEDVSDETAERVVSALRLLHGVADVSPVQGDTQSLLGAMRNESRWRDALLKLVRQGLEGS